MTERTEILIAKFIQNKEIYEYIVSCGQVTKNELLEYAVPLRVTMARSDIISELEPFITMAAPDEYTFDFDCLYDVLHNFFSIFMKGMCTNEHISEIVRSYLPGKLVYDASEVENSDNKQSYKFLYENLKEKYKELERDFYNQKFDYEESQKSLVSLNTELQNLKESGSMYENSTQALMRFVDRLLHEDIMISSVYAVDATGTRIQTFADKLSKVSEKDIALKPGVYNFMRPSWFTPLRTELSKINVGKESVKKTSPILNKILEFWKKTNDSDIPLENKAELVDRKRQAEIIKLLNDKAMDNAEKYLKYILLTPGMPEDFMKTLNGAIDLELSADVVIRLLEQPEEYFNKEIIEAYISNAHKSLEYNTKQNLAEELIQGKWMIKADMNGSEEIFQLVPYRKLQELSDQFEKVYEALEKQYGSLRATMTQSENKNNFEQVWEEILNQNDNSDFGNNDPEYDDDEEQMPEEDFSGFDKEAF